MAIIYGLKVNLSVAMVAMLNHTALKLSADLHKVSVLTTNITTSAAIVDDACSSGSDAGGTIEVKYLCKKKKKILIIISCDNLSKMSKIIVQS